MLGQAAQATISYLKLPQGNSCFPDAKDQTLVSSQKRIKRKIPRTQNDDFLKKSLFGGLFVGVLLERWW